MPSICDAVHVSQYSVARTFLGLPCTCAAFEIFHPNSTGTLLSIDAAVHQFALGLPVDFRYFWASE